jgi:hypothetical protein
MKTFTYAAAIALLTASAAFAQSSNTNMGTAGSNGSQTGISADKPASMNHQPADLKGSMTRPSNSSGRDMSNSADNSSMNQSMNKSSDHKDKSMASRDHAKARHMASNKGMKGSERNQDSKENQQTARLNQSQMSGNAMNNGTAMNGNGNSFDNGRPQAAQAGGADCSPDNPSCGTARQDPAINSSPQHRLQGASPAATSAE